MAYTEFCCRSSGSNLNAGTRAGGSTEPGTSADLTYASGTWANSTRTFTVASGNPVTDGVAVGDYVAIDTTSGTPPATYGGQVSSRTASTIVIDGTKNWGSNPANGTYTLRVGGAWAGPSGSSTFPFTLSLTGLTNPSGDTVRVNLKNNQTYAITSGISLNGVAAPLIFGYSTTYGDGGLATISGGTSGASYNTVFINSTSPIWLDSIKFLNNGSTGSTEGVSIPNNGTVTFSRCVFTGMCGPGVSLAGTAVLIECEVYGNNTNNTAGKAGVLTTAQTAMTRCVVHDNAGSNGEGVRLNGGTLRAVDCVFETNGKYGVNANGNHVHLINCDFYNNGSDQVNNSVVTIIENCNFTKGAAWGIGGTPSHLLVLNCGFGTGTQANASGDIQSARRVEIGTVTYASGVTPWTDPANGDFRITLAAAKAAGRGTFTETAASYAGTVAYPSIGAGQPSVLAAAGYSRGRVVNG